MKISCNWLKDFVDIKIPIEKLADQLTMAGWEVEKIERLNEDVVFELEITPNRPDCLNILGIAREISAILNKPLKHPSVDKIKTPSIKCPIIISEKKGCLRYLGTVIQNVRIGSSPDRIKKRLQALGIRSINNIVDITNYSLMENGQPLHAFDYDKLIGGRIIVRRACEGERFLALDGKEYGLDSSILVIADEKRPVAIAGIIGGIDTEVSQTTKTILLESAYFDPLLIRRASRRLGLSSDSSYRFERGVTLTGVLYGARRAMTLIQKIAGGRIVKHTDMTVLKTKTPARKIKISLEHINQYLGCPLSKNRCLNILKKLGFQTQTTRSAQISLRVPESRPDIKASVDIIEEVARIVGYDQLPLRSPVIKASQFLEDKKMIFKRNLRDAFIAQGLSEVITYTLINPMILQKTLLDHLPSLKVQNPITQDQEVLRPALLPSLLPVLLFNVNHGIKEIQFFELGEVYSPSGEEIEKVGILLTGRRTQDWRVLNKEEVDFFDMKGILENIFDKFRIKDVGYLPESQPFYAQDQSVQIRIQEQVLGTVGKIQPEILRMWDIKLKNVYFAQLDIETLFHQRESVRRYQAISEYPRVIRDISLAVKDQETFDELKKTALTIVPENLTAVNLMEQYLGEKIPSGYRGLTLSLVYQSPSRTLTDIEVNALHEKICQAFVERYGAIIR